MPRHHVAVRKKANCIKNMVKRGYVRGAENRLRLRHKIKNRVLIGGYPDAAPER